MRDNWRSFGGSATGCPPGVMKGFTFKTTANALQGRKLITVTKHAGSWFATLTDTGQHYLKHGAFPDGRSWLIEQFGNEALGQDGDRTDSAGNAGGGSRCS